MSSSHGGPAAKDNLEPVEYLGTSPSTCPPRRCFHQALVGRSDAWWWMKCPHVKLFSTEIFKLKGRRWSWFSVDFPTKHGLNGGAGPCGPPRCGRDTSSPTRSFLDCDNSGRRHVFVVERFLKTWTNAKSIWLWLKNRLGYQRDHWFCYLEYSNIFQPSILGINKFAWFT